MNYEHQIASQLKVRPEQVAATIALFDAGNTLPFVARYRKEQTDGLDEDQLRRIQTQLARLRELEDRRQTIIAAITEQGKLTDELHVALLDAADKTTLEDLYAPYKQKRRTRASIARERGLLPLAEVILAQAGGREPIEAVAARFLGDEVPSVDDALAGARDIVAETISEHAEVRRATRERALRWGVVGSQKITDAPDLKGVFQTYYEFEAVASRLRPYQVLALNRGESEGVLRIKLGVTERDWRDAVALAFRPDQRSPWADQLAQAIADSAERLLLPAIERDVRRTLTEAAEAHAITVFAKNVQALLLQPPIAGNVVLGIDPGFRTGCKIAVVAPTGTVLETTTIYPHTGGGGRDTALQTLSRLAEKHRVTLVAIGNGTASRETEQLAADLIKRLPALRYLIVSEAGASVYSASPLARAELPDLDVSLRGAVSIARRIQDPLAELVKIDPKSIGVGMYQHDVDQAQLNGSLDGVVETVVNRVGVDVNTASPALLRYVAGIGPKLSERIVAHRDSNGPFRNRVALKKVTGLGPKSFEQAAGFLRIRDGENPLDASAIHPESYAIANALLKKAAITAKTGRGEREQRLQAIQQQPLSALAAELGTGVPTLTDILEQLLRPGRDPRADLPTPILRNDVLSLADLQTGMRLQGTVRNVVDFGAFVDIGVKNDGLLHRSQFPAGVLLTVGDIINVEIQSVDAERGRIALAWAG
jgi:uncharacterized protein